MPRKYVVWGLDPSQPLTPSTTQTFHVCPSVLWNGDPAGHVCRLSIPMQKAEAAAAVGKRSLLLPAWTEVALAVNDRLKLFLSVMQAAAAHAVHPDLQMLDLAPEVGVTQSDAAWLRDMPAIAIQVDGALRLPNLQHFAKRAVEELGVMARPVLGAHDNAFRERVQSWFTWLGKTDAGELTNAQLRALTSGVTTDDEDSLHQLIMNLHKQLAELEHSLATEEIDGAHVWQVLPEDRTCIAAFMRGLNRTVPPKFDHTGLGIAVTWGGDKLLLQNDIGATDVHVLVIQVQAVTITVSYADLHCQRFEFFRSMLEPLDVYWEGPQSKLGLALNEEQPFISGTVRLECGDEASFDDALEGIGSRIVFLINWNRARRRLLSLVGKDAAVGILQEAARIDAGHMAWLRYGGEALIHSAMQAVGTGVFCIGDRLDTALDAAGTCRLLIDVLRLVSQAMLNNQPVTQLADQIRPLLMCSVRLYGSEFELLEEYAAYCHALAQSISNAFEHDVMNTSCMQPNSGTGASATQRLVACAKSWEREADELVTFAREKAQWQPRWGRFARVTESSDNVADALEETALLMSLIADDHQVGWNDVIRDTLCRLARMVQVAMQEHIKALAIACDLAGCSNMSDSDAFAVATWNVLRAERQCDEPLRQARHSILASMKDTAPLMLVNDLAQALELTSDRLLAVSYILRDAVFSQAEQV